MDIVNSPLTVTNDLATRINDFKAPVHLGQLVIGPVTIDMETGEVTLKEGTSLTDASKQFWDIIPEAFKCHEMVMVPRETVKDLVHFDGITALQKYL
jgi:hypothetical protein